MVSLTRAGVFVREDHNLGLLTYNPFTGLFFACIKKDRNDILNWLNEKRSSIKDPIYEKALGVGWSREHLESEFPTPHFLPPDSEDWRTIIPYSDKPILINWLLTGCCPQNCVYCYAQDVMNGAFSEPDESQIIKIANTIFQYEPLAVVLTGGDPLVSPFLEQAIRALYKKVGIIVDTGGYALNQRHFELFKEYNVLLRISLDSEIPKINDYLRPIKKEALSKTTINSVEAALNAILMAKKNNIRFAIQSVATTKNRSDFEAMGDKLFRLGVEGWRILMVSPSKGNSKYFLNLAGDTKSQERYFNHIIKQIRKNQKKDWKSKMSVQFSNNQVLNAIILVAPDGTFLTESVFSGKNNYGKIIIDPKCPKNPDKKHLLEAIDFHAHVRRYLNIVN